MRGFDLPFNNDFDDLIGPSEKEPSQTDFNLLIPQSEKNIFGQNTHESICISVPVGIQDAQEELQDKVVSTAEGTPNTIKVPELALDEKSNIISDKKQQDISQQQEL